MENLNRDLIDFINDSPTPFHVVRNVKMRLIEDGYTELFENEKWSLQKAGAYFVTKGDASVIAFRVPDSGFDGFQIVAAHTDSPTFKLAPSFELSGDYLRLSVEKYGGPVLASWLDRPLGIAGRIVVREGKRLVSKLVDSEKDIALIPSCPPHLMQNPDYKLSLKVDMPALAGERDSAEKLMSLLADRAGVEKENVVSHDLYLVNREKGRVWGISDEFLSAPKLDDLQCVFSSLSGFLLSDDEVNMPVLALFNSEEVGSGTAEGAGSTFLSDTLYRISLCLGGNSEDYLRLIANSFLVSADNAHGVHPNHPELFHENNKTLLNSGIVIKRNSQMRYITDGEGEAVFREICRMCDVPVGGYINRPDIAGGSTLGHIAISNIPVTGVDIGLPELAMHSSYETAGARDTEYAVRAFEAFFSAHIRRIGNDFIVE